MRRRERPLPPRGGRAAAAARAVQNAEELRSVWLPLIAANQLDPDTLAERLKDGERFLLEVYQGMVSNSARSPP